MARLRKPSPDEATFVPQSQAKSRQTSPRKMTYEPRSVPAIECGSSDMIPKSSRRGLRYTDDGNESFLVPKTIAVGDTITPRKQRVLQPVKSNSRLFRKLSDESLATPAKRQRERRDRSGTVDIDVDKRTRLMYAKTLAKSVANKQLKNGKIAVVGDLEVQEVSQRRKGAESDKGQDMMDTEAEDEEEETSLWCEDEEAIAQDKENTPAELESDESEDDDEDPVVHTKPRRRQIRSQPVIPDSDSDESMVVVKSKRATQPRSQPVMSESESSRSGVVVDAEKRKQRQGSNLPADQSEPTAEHEKQESRPLTSMRPPFRKGHSTISNWAQEVIDLTSSPETSATNTRQFSAHTRSTSFAASSRPTTSASNGAHAILTYSPTPTKQRSPRKAPPISRPSTPPLAPPSPTKLVSPSKKRPAIPKAAHVHGRPSLDAFWNPEVVNEWNDKHSPIKPLVSPRKQKWRDDIVKLMDGIALSSSDSDESYQSPTDSPKKKTPATSSPTKKLSAPEDSDVKVARAQRKAFATDKHTLAATFLTTLDTTLCSGRVTELSASTGGIQLIWSKTLKTTAGRANWRREQIRLRNPDASPPHNVTTSIRHHCSIELAEKVIDDEERLYNVLAHEFCHLATFLISNVRNNPHGAEFKSWGRRATTAFAHLGVQVTTKHSYTIEYKFCWECVTCGYEFKRHSRSVDPEWHSCGKCKGRLVQTRPVPRAGKGKGGGEGEKGARSEYQVFVKENFARVKSEMVGRGESGQMGKVMEAVAREYRERKAGGKVESVEVGLEIALEGLKI